MNLRIRGQAPLLVGILLLALFLRLGYLVEIKGMMSDSTFFCGGDAPGYDANGQAALRGEWPQGYIIGRNSVPLYSLYLAFIYGLLGVDYIIPLILQMLLDVVAVAAMYWVGKFIFSPLTGLLTALAMALYGPLISYQVCYAPVTLTTPLLILSFFFLFKYCRISRRVPKSVPTQENLGPKNSAFGLPNGYFYKKQILYLFTSGAMLGLCVLSRPTILIIAPVILLWFFWRRKSIYQFVLTSILFVIALGLVLVPNTLHNYRVSGKIIPISDQGPINFYFGNNQFSSGTGPHAIPGQFGQTEAGVFDFGGEFIEVSAKVAAGQTTYFESAIKYISEHPWEWAELTGKKVYLMFIEPDWKLLLTSVYYPSSSAALKNSMYLRFFPTEWVALMAMALLTLLFVRNRYVYLFWLTILAASIGIIFFFVKFRFRLPLAPFLLFLSFALITAGREWFQQDRRKFVVVLLILFGLHPFVPGLLIFIVIYIVVALFPYRGAASLLRLRWPIAAGWSYLVVISFILQMFVVHRTNAQTQNYFTGPKIYGPIIVGQTFSPDCDGLYQIDVELSRISFEHNQPYYFHLVRDLNLEDEIYSTQFEVEDVGKWTRKKFVFSPQVDSQQQPYFFYIDSPSSSAGNSLTVRLYPDLSTVHRRYEQGSAYAGRERQLQPFPADLAFAAYCQNNPAQLFFRTMGVMAASGPEVLTNPVIYLTIFVVHVLLLIVSLLKLGMFYKKSF
jgi:4-amino-4-deoxy-L-arabinose transferase-like glycosyltransferase